MKIQVMVFGVGLLSSGVFAADCSDVDATELSSVDSVALQSCVASSAEASVDSTGACLEQQDVFLDQACLTCISNYIGKSITCDSVCVTDSSTQTCSDCISQASQSALACFDVHTTKSSANALILTSIVPIILVLVW